jgi:hypothetical protein
MVCRRRAERRAPAVNQHPRAFHVFMFHALPWLCEDLTRRLPDIAPRAAVQKLDREPAYGAVLLAIADARGDARLPTYVP